MMTQPESPLAHGPVPAGFDPSYRRPSRLIDPSTVPTTTPNGGGRCNHRINVDPEDSHYEVNYEIFNSFTGINTMYLYGGRGAEVRDWKFARGGRGTVVFGVEPLPDDVITYWVTIPPGTYSTPVATWTGPDFGASDGASGSLRLPVQPNDEETEFISLPVNRNAGAPGGYGQCTGEFTAVQQIGTGVRASYRRTFTPGPMRSDYFWIGLYGPGDTLARSWDWAPNNSGEVSLPGPINRGDYLCYFAQEGPAYHYVALCEYYF